jgi:hypothetical protein
MTIERSKEVEIFTIDEDVSPLRTVEKKCPLTESRATENARTAASKNSFNNTRSGETNMGHMF